MSTYGRLWQRVSDIRDRLKDTVHGCDTSTLAKAAESVRAVQLDAWTRSNVDAMLSEWASLEQRMAPLDPHTGE